MKKPLLVLKQLWRKNAKAIESSVLSSPRLPVVQIPKSVIAIPICAAMIHGRRSPRLGIRKVSIIGAQAILKVHGRMAQARVRLCAEARTGPVRGPFRSGVGGPGRASARVLKWMAGSGLRFESPWGAARHAV